MASTYSKIVVGGGIIGSFTAYHLAKAGHKTLLLEQFPLPHKNGSSHGGSRIIRKVYKEDFFTEMMNEAFETWSEIERLAEEKLYTQTGVVYFVAPPYVGLQSMKDSLDKHSMPYETLNHEETCKRYLQITIPRDFIGLFDPSGGILRASKALDAVQKLFQENGGVLLDDCAVTDIEPGDTVTVKTTKGDFQTESLVLCVGTWSNKLLKNVGLQLPFKLLKVTIYYWEEKERGQMSAENGFPCFIIDSPNDKAYAIPSLEYPGHVKFLHHTGVPFEIDSSPTASENDPFKEKIIEKVKKYIPALKPKPSMTDSCKYTETPDLSCVLDYHPQYKNIVIGAGFSGTGFKISPTAGRILSDLSNCKDPGCNMGPFSINRFK